MTAQQLRNSILQQAIQGRLVPQDPNDEPASVLLERIRKEKEQLVKEGKLKKKDLATTPIADDEKPFDIPSGWEWARLGDCMDVRDGTHDTPKYTPSGIPLVTSKNLKNGRIDLSEVKFISKEDSDSINLRSNVDNEDILFAMIGSIGNPVLVKKEYEFSIKNMALFKKVGRFLFMPYIWHMLFFLQNDMRAYASGAVQSFVSLSYLRNYPIPLPPLAEQRRIVAKIEELMPLVEKYGKAQTELDTLNQDLPRRLRQSVLQQAIQGKLVEQDPNDEPASGILEKIKLEKESLLSQKILKKIELEDYTLSVDEVSVPIPDGWSFVKLREICTLIDGEKRTEKHICMDAKYLRGKSSGEYLTQGKFVTKGSNIILVDGENSGEVFVTPIDGYMGSTFKQLWISQEMYTPYVMYVLRSFKETLRKDKRGAAIPHLNKDLFFNFEVGIPPLAEQRRIVAKIEELFAEIDKLK